VVIVSLAFVPFGAFLAGLALGAMFTAFALAGRLLDRATTRAGDSILPGLVSGFRDWSDRRGLPLRSSVTPVEQGQEVVDRPEVVDLA
jgi:hypothetical protein